MQTYEFSTKIGPGGKLVILEVYTKHLPVGDSVRVIIVINEPHATIADQSKGQNLLAQVVAEIRSTRQNPANLQHASGLLAEHLANAPHEVDPSFDTAV
jgi:hypothetical protein